MRRANGTGTVVKLSGNRRRPYAVKVSTRDRDGYVKQVALSYHEKLPDAQAALDEYVRKRAAGRAPSADLLSITVQQVYDAWSERAFPKYNPSSRYSYQAAWKKRISRYADRKMRSVSLDEWQAILDEDENEGRSQSLINNDAILIRALHNYAMKRDILAKDYSQYLDVPIVGSKVKKGAFDDLQLAALERLARSGFPGADTALILCYTGFRISEFLALTPFSYHPECGGYLQGGTKSEAGRDRIVPVHSKIAPYLQRWLCEEERISTVRYRTKVFAPIAQELGVPAATPHWCRHTFATMLQRAGVDALSIKLLMGHSIKNDVTAGYIHPTPSDLAMEIRKLA